MKSLPAATAMEKAPTGIEGLDEITEGGLPRGRTTLVCGSAGCGKTLLGMEFLIRGIDQGENGVFMAFEENAEELAQNVHSLGFDLAQQIKRKRLVIDFVRVEKSEIDETGEYDLEALFIRLEHAIDSIKAKRVVIDTLEALFVGFSNESALRSELRRLFRWLKDKGVTAIVTGERGSGQLTRHGLEEYVSDCVILLDHRVIDQVSTRRLRIVKYRGTTHGTNEYPFLIDEDGITVLPITSIGLQHVASKERISSGVPALDAMLGGHGYYRGTTVLISGTAGSGKSSLASHFARAACERGERCLYFAFEESPAQITRNMKSIGVNLDPWLRRDLLRFHAIRSTLHGLEMHLTSFYKLIANWKPKVVVLDPIGSLMQAGSRADTHAMLTRLIDYLKLHGITALLTSLTSGDEALETTDVEISSIVDSWLLLRDIEVGGERNRALYVLKSRGMAHSNQIREFILSDRGIQLLDPYVGPGGVMTGSMRIAQEARERAAGLVESQEIERKSRERKRLREALESRIEAMRKEFDAQELESDTIVDQSEQRQKTLANDRRAMSERRQFSQTSLSAQKTARKTTGSLT